MGKRLVQHVADLGDIKEAKRKGEKVEVLCGKRVYPMTEMDESIPTCTPCHRAERAEHKRQMGRLEYRFSAWTWVA